MFERAADLMMQGIAEQSVCLMDLPDDWGQAGNLDLYLKTLDGRYGIRSCIPTRSGATATTSFHIYGDSLRAVSHPP